MFSDLREIDVAVIQKDVLDQHTELYIKYRYYVGLGMASLVLVILGCFIMGLFLVCVVQSVQSVIIVF